MLNRVRYTVCMNKAYRILGLIGAIAWTATVLIREAGPSLSPALTTLLGVMPNFGVVWLGMSIALALFPMALHKEATRMNRYGIIAAILALLLLSEIIHEAFLGARFDWQDILASCIAAIPLCLMNAFDR